MAIKKKLEGTLDDDSVSLVAFRFDESNPVAMEIHFAVNGTTDTLVVDIDDPPELARARKVHRFAERKLQVELD